jgi:hypothetical protein
MRVSGYLGGIRVGQVIVHSVRKNICLVEAVGSLPDVGVTHYAKLALHRSTSLPYGEAWGRYGG